MKPTFRTGSGSIAKIIGPARALFFLVALFVVATWGTSLPAQTVTLYQQNFQTTSGPNGDVYFNVASPYNGITDGTGTGASFAGNSLLNGQIITSTSGTSSGQGGPGNFLFDNSVESRPTIRVAWKSGAPIPVSPWRQILRIHSRSIWRIRTPAALVLGRHPGP
jgi:hypothetical protein